VLIASLKILGMVSTAQHGAGGEGAPSLTIVVPPMTVLGVLILRATHGLGVHFNAHAAPGKYLSMLSTFLSVQIAFLLFGAAVLRAQGYFGRFVTGPDASPASYGLVCLGVAFAVIMQFFINKGLVGAGPIEKFDVANGVLSGGAEAALLAIVVLVLN